MALIQIENLTFAYPGSYDAVFENVNLQLDTDWRLGFTGRNGRGKTTLLRLLLGEYEYAGRIACGVPCDYFPFPVPDETQPAAAVLQSVCPAADWELRRELSLLDVSPAALEQPFSTLSSGERTKMLLAALFLREGHFLLIDEPTNHLDMAARARVSSYLKKKRGFILVSHDRAFLDGCVDHILSINKANIELQSGSFSSYLENFARQQAFERAQNAQLEKEIARMRQSAGQTADWSARVERSKIGAMNAGVRADKGYIGHKAAKLMKRAKAAEQREQQAIEEKSRLLKNTEFGRGLKLAPLAHHAERLVTLENVCVRYGARTVCGPVELAVCRGERLALDGKNGSGKSSLLKLILGEDVPHTGRIQRAGGLSISYVAQDADALRGDLSAYAARRQIDESLFKAILRNLGLERIQFEKDMAALSGGQKKKVLIAASLCERAHLYIWDEPLNFIDLPARMQIEEMLPLFAPTMIFVEHDRAFREHIATAVFSL